MCPTLFCLVLSYFILSYCVVLIAIIADFAGPIAAIVVVYFRIPELRVLQGAHAAVATGRAIQPCVLEVNGQCSSCRA